MSLDVFCKIIENSQFEDPIKRLCLYKEGEPLLNKQLPQMIRYAKEKNVAETICTVSNGSMLDEQTAQLLSEAGLDEICISIPGITDDVYKEITNTNVSFEKIQKGIQHLRNKSCKVIVKIIDNNYNEYQKKAIEKQFCDMCDTVIFYSIRHIWPGFNTKSNQDIEPDDLDMSKKICTEIFTSLVVNSDGSVSACFVDWNWELLIGNALDKSLTKIWNGDELRMLRRNHLLLNRQSYKPCSLCITSCESDINLEPIRNFLLKKKDNEYRRCNERIIQYNENDIT